MTLERRQREVSEGRKKSEFEGDGRECLTTVIAENRVDCSAGMFMRCYKVRNRDKTEKLNSWWRSRVGRTLVFDRRTFPVLFQTASWTDDHFVGQTSAIGQQTWPTQPSIP